MKRIPTRDEAFVRELCWVADGHSVFQAVPLSMIFCVFDSPEENVFFVSQV